jgi:hypothetical protein
MDLLWARLLHEETDLFVCVASFIWGQRNKVMHEGTIPNPMAVVKQAKLLYSGSLQEKSFITTKKVVAISPFSLQ